MSTTAMTQMLDKAMSDEGFAKGLVEAVGDKSGSDAVSAVVSYGTDNGFSVTDADAVEMQKQLLSQADGSDGDLADDDLENVSGGVGLGNLANLMGGGGALGNMLGGGMAAGGIAGAANSAIGTASGVANQAVSGGMGMANNAINTGASAVNNFVKQW